MKTRIIVDSTADLSDEALENVIVVPLTVYFGDEEYIDGVTINHRQFYEKLIETDTVPHTSQASPSDFSKVFDKIKRNGESAVVITLSAKLSGTYQSAVIAADEYKNIYIVDSESVTIGSGILAEFAINLANNGIEAKELAEILDNEKKLIEVIAMLDTLEYLKRGGRISKTAAFAGSVLNIKPVISVKNGKISILGKARGSKQGNNLLIQEIKNTGGVDFNKPLLLGYTGLSDATLNKYIEDSGELWKNNTDNLNTTVVGSVIGTHSGPGAIAAAFFKCKK